MVACGAFTFRRPAEAAAVPETAEFVKHNQMSVCSKCRYQGCEKCSYLHCLRHVVRHQKPGEWWLRSSQIAVEGSLRFLNRT